MYLVHWPIVALYRYKFGLSLSWVEQIGLSATTLSATVLLHYGVERRFYRRLSDRAHSSATFALSDGAFALRSLAVSAFVAAIATHAWLGDGWSWLVLGNSHEPDGYNFAMSAFGARDDTNIIVFGQTNRCGTISRSDARWASPKAGCDSRLSALQSKEFVDVVDMIVYAARRPLAKNKKSFLRLLKDLKAENPRIHVVTLGGYLGLDFLDTLFSDQ